MTDAIHQMFMQNDKNTEKKLVTYKKILNSVYKKIKNLNRYKQNSCFFEVPHFIIGRPIFDIKICMVYIISELRKNHFYVKYNYPNILYISWKNLLNADISQLTFSTMPVKTTADVRQTRNNTLNNNDTTLFGSNKISSKFGAMNDKLSKSL